MSPKNAFNPMPAGPARLRCPVCREVVYSRAGIHPQCAVKQSDPPKPKAVPPGATAPPGDTLDPGSDAAATPAKPQPQPAKTNAVRLLERLGVAFELRTYEVDPDDLSAESVALKVGLPAGQVFKTLVVRGDKHGVCLAVVPGDQELDPKALARATGDKKADTVPLKEVESLTGYVRGGVTALACKKPYPVWLDASALAFEVISVSAGVRGVQVLIAPSDYARAVGAKTAAVAKTAD